MLITELQAYIALPNWISQNTPLLYEGNHYCAQYLANSGLYYQLKPRKDMSHPSPQI